MAYIPPFIYFASYIYIKLSGYLLHSLTPEVLPNNTNENMNFTKAHDMAAGEIVELILDKLGENRQIHPSAAISAAARLAGSFYFRSFNVDLNNQKPGSAVLSEQANEKGPLLLNVLSLSLSSFGIKLDKNSIRTSSKVESDLSFLDSLTIFQEKAHEIMNRNELTLEQMAHACAMATAFIIKECESDLSVESGFKTAVYAFIEGIKTCPPLIGGYTQEN